MDNVETSMIRIGFGCILKYNSKIINPPNSIVFLFYAPILVWGQGASTNACIAALPGLARDSGSNPCQVSFMVQGRRCLGFRLQASSGQIYSVCVTLSERKRRKRWMVADN